jgi:hypothetical protein
MVARKKPAPDIYQLAVDRLGADRREVLVIEDSRNGVLAALGAGLCTLVTVSAFTVDEKFPEAALVVSSLGDPGGESTKVLANRTTVNVGDWVTLGDLYAYLKAVPTDERN